jgi:hypothetical protein
MSATGRTAGQRDPDDFYATPAWSVSRILEAVGLLPRDDLQAMTRPYEEWLDPCAGMGAIIEACRDRGVRARWTACELEASYEPALLPLANRVVMGDFFRVVPARYDVAIFNPPFPLAEQFVRACLPIARHVLCLQRLNWAAKRKDLLDEWPCDVWVLPDRPAFGLNKHGKVGTDATEYGWFHWGPERGGGGYFRVLAPTPKAELKAHADLIRRLAKRPDMTVTA